MGVVGTVTRPLVAVITRRTARIRVNRCRATAMSAETVARTAASRPWRPRGVPTPRIERKIQATGVNQQPLENVLVTTQMRAPHATGVVEMRQRAVAPLAALPRNRRPRGPRMRRRLR